MTGSEEPMGDSVERAPGLDVSRSRDGCCHLLTLRGELISSSTIQSLNEMILNFLRANRGGKVILDLHQLEFASSRAVSMLAGLTRSAVSGGGALVLANPSENLRELLELAGEIRDMRVFDTVDEALERIGD